MQLRYYSHLQVNRCIDCEKEFGLSCPNDVSHGYCQRHTLQRVKTACIELSATTSIAVFSDCYKAAANTADWVFAPDLGKIYSE